MEVREGHDVGEVCECVTWHTPRPIHIVRHHIVPLYAGGGNEPGNLVWLCPTSHEAIHVLLREWERHEGEPPWEIRRSVNGYVRELAARGWAGRQT